MLFEPHPKNVRQDMPDTLDVVAIALPVEQVHAKRNDYQEHEKDASRPVENVIEKQS